MKPNSQTQQQENFPISIPITQQALQTAQKFVSQTPHQQIAQQIYHKTLGLCTVCNFLEMFGYPFDLSKSDSWNPIMRWVSDGADLYIPGKGYLECCPVQAGDSVYHVPIEAQSNRIGFVVVEIDEEQQVALIRGFAPSVTGETLLISQLQSATSLLDYLAQPPNTVDLRQWLEELFQLEELFPQEWELPEAVLNKRQLVTISSTRRSTKRRKSSNQITDFKPVKRVKKIELNHHHFLLLISLKPNNEDLEVRVQVFRDTLSDKTHASSADLDYLPPHLKLRLLTSEGQLLEEVTSRSEFLDDSIQISKVFSQPEQFSCEISLNGVEVIEHFTI